MPLPFLQKKQVAGVIVSHRKPDGSKEESHSEEEDSDHSGLTACMRELASALKSDNHEAAAEAFRSAFQILDAEPHEEGPHTNEEEPQE